MNDIPLKSCTIGTIPIQVAFPKFLKPVLANHSNNYRLHLLLRHLNLLFLKHRLLEYRISYEILDSSFLLSSYHILSWILSIKVKFCTDFWQYSSTFGLKMILRITHDFRYMIHFITKIQYHVPRGKNVKFFFIYLP